MNKINYIENTEDLYQNAPCGFLSLLIDGTIVNINDTLLKWLDFKREECIGRKTFQDLLNVGGKIYFETHLMPLLQMQGEVKEINMEMRGKRSIIIPVLMNVNRFIDENGTAVYRISVLDISDRKKYEQALLISRKESDAINQKLQQVNQELERFAYVASHDLKAPINTISGLVDLLQKKQLILPGQKSEEIFSLIMRNTRRMKMMIQDLHDYSSIESKVETFEWVSLNEVCDQALEMIDDEVQKNMAIFSIEPLPMVNGIKIQLIRLFQNLFSNAIKYRSKSSPLITVSSEKAGDYEKILVKDNGIGFNPSSEEKIFGFMERLHSKDNIEGSGIGLSACKRIVEKHGGQIGATSTPGKGSIFYFTLPIRKIEDSN